MTRCAPHGCFADARCPVCTNSAPVESFYDESPAPTCATHPDRKAGFFVKSCTQLACFECWEREVERNEVRHQFEVYRAELARIDRRWRNRAEA